MEVEGHMITLKPGKYEADIRLLKITEPLVKRSRHIVVPKIHNGIHIPFQDWCKRYDSFLEPFIDSIWKRADECGMLLKYGSFYRDMLVYIYKSSVSRYTNFTFIE